MEPVTVHYRQGKKVLEVDTQKVLFKGLRYHQLGSWGRQKYENKIFMEHVKGLDAPIMVTYA